MYYRVFKEKFEKEIERQKAARVALEKINSLQLVVPDSEDLEQIRARQGRSTLVCIAATVGASLTFMKRWPLRLFFMGCGFFTIKLLLSPYYLAEMMETIAEKPSEAGQAARAVLIFKSPNHELRQKYENLSTQYRNYKNKLKQN